MLTKPQKRIAMFKPRSLYALLIYGTWLAMTYQEMAVPTLLEGAVVALMGFFFHERIVKQRIKEIEAKKNIVGGDTT